MTLRRPPQPPPSFLRRNGRTLLAVGLFALLVHDVFGAHGLLAMRRARSEMERLRQEMQKINQENRGLADQVKALKSDPKMIERIAREEMGLARPGELIFKLPAPPPNQQTPKK